MPLLGSSPSRRFARFVGGRIVAGHAQKLPADQGLGRHRAAGLLAGPIAGQAAILAGGDALQEPDRAGARLLGHRDAGQLGAFQGHQLPAELAGVARFVRLVAPAAGGRMLGGEGVGDGSAQRLFEPVVVRHGVGFAHRERRHAVAIHE